MALVCQHVPLVTEALCIHTYLVKLIEGLPELGVEKLFHGLRHELHDRTDIQDDLDCRAGAGNLQKIN